MTIFTDCCCPYMGSPPRPLPLPPCNIVINPADPPAPIRDYIIYKQPLLISINAGTKQQCGERGEGCAHSRAIHRHCISAGERSRFPCIQGNRAYRARDLTSLADWIIGVLLHIHRKSNMYLFDLINMFLRRESTQVVLQTTVKSAFKIRQDRFCHQH